MGEQAGGAGEQRNCLDHRGGEAEIEQAGGDRHGDVHRQGAAPDFLHRRHEAAGKVDVGAGDAALVGERQDASGARIDRLVQRVAEARHGLAALVDGGATASDGRIGVLAGGDALAGLGEDRGAGLRRCRG